MLQENEEKDKYLAKPSLLQMLLGKRDWKLYLLPGWALGYAYIWFFLFLPFIVNITICFV